MRRFSLSVILIAALGLLVGACQPQPVATPTPTRTPGAVISGPTLTPTAVITQPAPTAGSASPVGPDSYPPGVNPLTGLPVSDPAVLNRRPLAIKVSNYIGARPQAGLSFADHVWEHIAEGGETRFTGIFYSQSPERVGSVRSGRLIDLEIVPIYDAILVASGFSDGTRKRIDARPWSDRNLSGPFVGEPSLVRIPMPNVDTTHTLFAIPAEVWNLANQRGVNQAPVLAPGMAFNSAVPAGGTPASQFSMEFGVSHTKVEWRYDAASGKYLRWMGGEPHTDALTEQQLAFENIILIGAMHVKADYIEDGASGELSTEIQAWGEGPATLFRDGQRIDGKWTRMDPENMFVFTDLSGNVLTFKPGQTWFEMIPIGYDKLVVSP